MFTGNLSNFVHSLFFRTIVGIKTYDTFEVFELKLAELEF